MDSTPNSTQIASKWALINTAIYIVFIYSIQIFKVDTNSPLNYIEYLPFISFLLLAQNELKRKLGGIIGFKTAFSIGFRFAVFTGLMIGVFMFLYFTVLNPSVFEKTLALSLTLNKAQHISAEQIASARKYGPIRLAFAGAVSTTLVGAIASLPGAALWRKE